MSERNKAIVRRYLEQVIGKGDWAVADELLVSDFVFTSPYTPEPVRGREAFKGMIGTLRASFPDMHVEEHAVIAEGDLVATRWLGAGTHTGTPFGALPAGGKHWEMTGMSMYRVREGRIVEGWLNDDTFGMMRQLGAIPDAAHP